MMQLEFNLTTPTPGGIAVPADFVCPYCGADAGREDWFKDSHFPTPWWGPACQSQGYVTNHLNVTLRAFAVEGGVSFGGHCAATKCWANRNRKKCARTIECGRPDYDDRLKRAIRYQVDLWKHFRITPDTPYEDALVIYRTRYEKGEQPQR